MHRPARLERVGAMTPRDRIWAAIRRFGQAGEPGNWTNFSAVEIAFLAHQHADTVTSYLRALDKAGYVQAFVRERPLVNARCELTRFALVHDVGVDAPRVDADGKPVTRGRGREFMWTAMRKHRGAFDWRELALCSPQPIAETEAQTYLGFLARAGYLRTLKKGVRGQPQQYEFDRARDTGPRPPIVTQKKEVKDGNTGDIVYAGGARG